MKVKRTGRFFSISFLLLLICYLCTTVIAELPTPRNWAETTVDDLHFIRATLRENHPGPIDSKNLAFQDWYRHGFELALARAQAARDFAGYFFAIKFYMAGFQDGHLGALGERHLLDHLSEGRLHRKWPGFTVAYKNNSFIVDATDPSVSPLQNVGDQLIACDGRTTAAWADEIIGGYAGLWNLPGTRPEMAPLLLIDEGNPFIRMPDQCTFHGRGGNRTIGLHWVAITDVELRSKFMAYEESSDTASIHIFGDGAYWVRLPSFETNSQENSASLKRITDELRQQAETMRHARVIVFDVRGNRGGNSTTGEALLVQLWGEQYIKYIQPQPAAIDWRLSRGNLRFLKDTNLATLRRQFGSESGQAREYEDLLSKMQQALDGGKDFYREEIARPPASDSFRVSAVPVLLTDHACASACLDFADIVLALPRAQHAGLETSADAVYIDNRAVALPSGLGLIGFSMKVYRGRPRGNNQSYRPAHVYPGDIADITQLEKWIMSEFLIQPAPNQNLAGENQN
jgi:hypothetical protein